MTTKDKIWITTLGNPGPYPPFSTAISPLLNRIAVLNAAPTGRTLSIHSIPTGESIAPTEHTELAYITFTRDGRQIWCGNYMDAGEWQGWIIVDNDSDLVTLERLGGDPLPSAGLPWQSLHGYNICDGWILDSTRKRVLWLPHRWRSRELCRKWDGQFLGLLHKELPEPVILEFFE